jgi:hypothetical protein
MLGIGRISRIIALPLIIIAVALSNTGCNTDKFPERTPTVYKGPEIQYSTYEIEATDVRFGCFQHPLYRLEYPSIFNLVDENLADIPHISCDETQVDFTVQKTGIPKPTLSIIVGKPGHREYHDAAGALDFWIDEISEFTDNFSVKKTKVMEIPAYYLEAHFIQDKEIFYSKYQAISRSVFFDYADLIWEIGLDWCYRGLQTPEVEEYFNHVIEAFEILE